MTERPTSVMMVTSYWRDCLKAGHDRQPPVPLSVVQQHYLTAPTCRPPVSRSPG